MYTLKMQNLITDYPWSILSGRYFRLKADTNIHTNAILPNTET